MKEALTLQLVIVDVKQTMKNVHFVMSLSVVFQVIDRGERRKKTSRWELENKATPFLEPSVSKDPRGEIPGTKAAEILTSFPGSLLFPFLGTLGIGAVRGYYKVFSDWLLAEKTIEQSTEQWTQS